MRHETKGKFWRVGDAPAAGRRLVASRANIPCRGADAGSILEFGGSLVASVPPPGETWTTVEAGSRQAASVASAAEEGVGEGTAARAIGRRVLHRCMDVATNRGRDSQAFWRSLPSRTCMEIVARGFGMELSEAGTAGQRTGRRGHRTLEAVQVAPYKKRRAQLVPIWPFWMKADSSLSRMSARHGGRAGIRLAHVIATDMIGSPRSRSSPSRQFASDSDCSFIFTSPISRLQRSSSSCAPCFDISAARSCCCGMAVPFTGAPTSKPSCVLIPDCTPNAFPLTPRNSIPMNSSGPKPNANWLTVHRPTCRISAAVWKRASGVSEVPNDSWLHAYPVPSCCGRECIHYLCEAQ